MADRNKYTKEEYYRHVVKMNNEYIRNTYKKVNVKVSADEKAAWLKQSEADGSASLKEWIINSCRSSKYRLFDKRPSMNKQYTYITLNFKPEEYDILKAKADKANLTLRVYIKNVCDKKAGYEG